MRKLRAIACIIAGAAIGLGFAAWDARRNATTLPTPVVEASPDVPPSPSCCSEAGTSRASRLGRAAISGDGPGR